MCGRYEFSDEKDIKEIHKILTEINNKYNGTATCKTGEIFPTNTMPVLSIEDEKPSLSLMQWGFPKWDGKGVVINAKSETAAEKRMFSKSLLERRCVIPSTGFYEWQKVDSSKAKDKYLFLSEHSPMLYMAGIFNLFQVGDTFAPAFVIFTRSANDSIADIHDRMPVILHKHELTDWLKDGQFIDVAFRRDDVGLQRQKIG